MSIKIKFSKMEDLITRRFDADTAKCVIKLFQDMPFNDKYITNELFDYIKHLDRNNSNLRNLIENKLDDLIIETNFETLFANSEFRNNFITSMFNSIDILSVE
jgi:hypothetical protein